jgi:hypothetical protein
MKKSIGIISLDFVGGTLFKWFKNQKLLKKLYQNWLNNKS